MILTFGNSKCVEFRQPDFVPVDIYAVYIGRFVTHKQTEPRTVEAPLPLSRFETFSVLNALSLVRSIESNFADIGV